MLIGLIIVFLANKEQGFEQHNSRVISGMLSSTCPTPAHVHYSYRYAKRTYNSYQQGFRVLLTAWSYPMMMGPNKEETTVHGFHSAGAHVRWSSSNLVIVYVVSNLNLLIKHLNHKIEIIFMLYHFRYFIGDPKRSAVVCNYLQKPSLWLMFLGIIFSDFGLW